MVLELYKRYKYKMLLYKVKPNVQDLTVDELNKI